MIITLSRQFGAGARTIGRELSSRLGVRLLDRDLLPLVAERLETEVETVASLDEQLDPLSVRMVQSLGASAPEAMLIDALPEVNADYVERTTREIITELAARESLIIIGRGGRWIVGDRPDALHIRLVAAAEVRIERLMAKEGLDRKAAEHAVRSTDRARASYVHRYYDVDWNLPEQYHLVLNTGLVSLPAAVDLVALAARHLPGGPEPMG